MRYVFYIFWILVILVGITFASLNPQRIILNYYLDTKSVHLPLMVLATLVIGAVLGIIAMLPSLIKSRSATRRMKHRIKQIEQEVQNLRNIPIKDSH